MTYNVTDADVVKLEAWAVRLESGKDEQVPGTLCRLERDEHSEVVSEGFCCLGVLTEQAVADGVIERNYDGSYGELSDESTLPIEVVEWIGLDENPTLQIPEHLREKAGLDHEMTASSETAVSLNDDYHFTFPEIAECIRFTFGIEKKS